MLHGKIRLGNGAHRKALCRRKRYNICQARRRHDRIDAMIAPVVSLRVNTEVQVNLRGRGNDKRPFGFVGRASAHRTGCRAA